MACDRFVDAGGQFQRAAFRVAKHKVMVIAMAATKLFMVDVDARTDAVRRTKVQGCACYRAYLVGISRSSTGV